jgi:hypothetical protein
MARALDFIAKILSIISIVIFKWPAFLILTILIWVELALYLGLRYFIWFLESLRIYRSHRKLRRKVRFGEGITSYNQWQDAAKLLDKYDGRDKWKAHTADPIYNHKIIQKLILELHTTREQIADLLSISPTLQQIAQEQAAQQNQQNQTVSSSSSVHMLPESVPAMTDDFAFTIPPPALTSYTTATTNAGTPVPVCSPLHFSFPSHSPPTMTPFCSSSTSNYSEIAKFNSFPYSTPNSFSSLPSLSLLSTPLSSQPFFTPSPFILPRSPATQTTPKLCLKPFHSLLQPLLLHI